MNIEQKTAQAIISALSGTPLPIHHFASRGHYGKGDRSIDIDLGEAPIGHLIGFCGETKLAIQAVLSAPMDADACQIRYRSTQRDHRILGGRRENQKPTAELIEPMLEQLQRLHGLEDIPEVRVELSDSAAIAIIKTSVLMGEAIRQPLSKIIRECGKMGGFIATLSITSDEPAEAYGRA